MKTLPHLLAPALVALALLVSPDTRAADWTAGMKDGKAEFKSMGPLAFGPDGILFVADTTSAAVIAVATGDTQPASSDKPLKVEAINQKIAALLGTTADQILINDLAVNPVSRNAYLAVSRGRGPDAIPVLLRVKAGGEPEVVSLDKVKFSRGELPDVPVEGVTKGKANTGLRAQSITDSAFLEDRLLIAGLSNEEFDSTLRAIPFPFKTVANGTTVEIYHGAHGAFETRSPVRTFVPFKVGDKPSVLAAYTCTPLVHFPLSDLQPGGKVKGKTVAELGNRNRPIDMIVYQKDGKDFLLLANSSRGVMKIGADKIAGADGILTPVKEEKKGVEYETVAGWTGVEHLDRFDTRQALVLRKAADGGFTLESLAYP